jgi:hypothetical protein
MPFKLAYAIAFAIPIIIAALTQLIESLFRGFYVRESPNRRDV